MIREPKLCPSTVTVGAVRQLFTDDHVHAALLVSGRRLLTVIERCDIAVSAPHDAPALLLGQLYDRVTTGAEPLELVYQRMHATGQRRLAVIDQDGALLGLLCLKRSRTGFCSEHDIRDRAAEQSPS